MSLKLLNETAPFLAEKCTGNYGAEKQTSHLLHQVLLLTGLPCVMRGFKEILRSATKKNEIKDKVSFVVAVEQKIRGKC